MRNRATLILTTVKLHYWQLAGGILKPVLLTRITRSFQVIAGGKKKGPTEQSRYINFLLFWLEKIRRVF